MFSPVGGAYSLLRQVKGKYAEGKPLFDKNTKSMMQHLAYAPFDSHDKSILTEDLNMVFRPVDSSEEASRRAVLTISDAFELLAVWDWLYRLEHGMNVDEYADDIKLLGNELSRLIRAVDDHPSVSLMGTRDMGKSIGASYFAHKDSCLKYLDVEGSESAYKMRVNLVFKYYLNLQPMYEETKDGI